MSGRFETFSVSVFRITRCWQEIAAAEMRRYGLKSSCALYLTTLLSREEAVSAAELCCLCGRDKADVSRSVAAMMEKGLLEPKQGRQYRAPLVLTEQGREVARQINGKAAEAVSLAGSGLSDSDREAFYRALELISGNLERLSRDGLPAGQSNAKGE